MENDREPVEDIAIKKNASKSQQVPKTQYYGRSLERVGQIVPTLEPGILDRITFESEKLRDISGSSSRRHSDDGGRAKKEFQDGKWIQIFFMLCVFLTIY